MKKFCLAFVCIFATIEGAAQPVREEEPVDSVSYIIYLAPGETLPRPDLDDFNRMAVNVVFKVNKTNILPEDAGYRALIDNLKLLQGKGRWLCRMMAVRGAASPEGPLANNERLSRGRAAALLDSIGKYVDVFPDMIDLSRVSEDYDHLCYLLERSDDPERAGLVDTISRYRDDPVLLKSRLRAMQGGETWRRLLRTLYPKLRTARLLLYLTPEPQPGKPLPVREIPPPLPADRIEEERHPLAQPAPQAPRRAWLAVRTNLLMDVMYMPRYGLTSTPNIALEYYPVRGHWTAGIELTRSGWRHDGNGKCWILRNYQAEVRRYFKGAGDFTGLYLSGYAHYAEYDIAFGRTPCWQGEGWGAGVGIGWVKRLGVADSPWKLHVGAAFGYFRTKYDGYHKGEEWADPGDFYYDWHNDPKLYVRRNSKFEWEGPTRVELSISYDLLYRPRKAVWWNPVKPYRP